MSTPCTIIQSGSGLAVLGKPASSHIVDPIFRPRRRMYSSQELKYIGSLAPFDVLPPTLRPSRTNRTPPMMHFGWIIGDESKARLMAKAYETKRYFYVYDEVFLEEKGAQGPLLLDEFDTIEGAALDIVVGLGIKLPILQFVDGVLTGAEHDSSPCFNLFTNRQLDKNLPSEEDIERIQKEFKFEGKPGWWPAFDFSWIP